MLAEPKDSKLQIPQPAIGHNPESFPSSSHPNYLPKIHLNVSCHPSLVIQVAIFQGVFLSKFNV
jgi:hypothetical protein